MPQGYEAYLQQALSKYRNPDSTKRDVLTAIQHYRGLFPKMETFVFNDGSTKELLNLDGTIPVPYKGNTYNIPVCLWLLDTHPYNPPLCYVKPTNDMQIKISRHVDQSGKIYLPYLHEWKYNSSDLPGLIQVMIIIFGEQPPVYARSRANDSSAAAPVQPGPQPPPPVGHPNQPPPPYPATNPSYMPMPVVNPSPLMQMPQPGGVPSGAPPSGGHYQQGQQQSMAPTVYPPAYPAAAYPAVTNSYGYQAPQYSQYAASGNPSYPPQNPSAGYPSSATPSYPPSSQPGGYPPNSSTPAYPPTSNPSYTSYPPPPQQPPTTSAYAAAYGPGFGMQMPPTLAPQQQAANNTITEEHIKASLVSAVEDKIKRRLREVHAQAQAEMDVLKRTQDDLNRGKSKLENMISRLEQEQLDLEKNILVLNEKNEAMTSLISKMQSQEQIDVDEAVVTVAPLYKQLLNAFAEENAIEDTVYYLGEALRRQVIDLDVFMKHVRELSRKQFMLRALMQKCREKASLPV